ncbi:MAG: aldehyde dehydrogenase family protein, partial [Candidatus Limnocylindria bacterium]
MNPATEEEVSRLRAHSDLEVDAALDLAVRTAAEWRDRSFAERGQVLERVADAIERQHE